MRVKILKTDGRLGLVAGEIYQAERYRYDPREKVSLLSREPDGHDPECNQYTDSVAFWVQGQWMVVRDSQYVPEGRTE
jgi:hypothetical protein